MEFLHEFEYRKLNISSTKEGVFRLKFSSYIDEIFQQLHPGEKVKSQSNAISYTRNWLTITPEHIKKLICDVVDKTINEIRRMKADPIVNNITTVIAVGGFSAAKILQEHLKTSLPDMKFIFPTNDAVKAVLYGAVLYGLRPQSIFARVSSHTYGLGQYRLFDEKEHDPKKKTVIKGRSWCTDCFIKIVEEGEIVVLGKSVFTTTLKPLTPDQGEMSVPIYESLGNRYPKYTTDDGVQQVGELIIDISNNVGNANRSVLITVHMGAEFLVTGENEETKEKRMITVKFDSK